MIKKLNAQFPCFDNWAFQTTIWELIASFGDGNLSRVTIMRKRIRSFAHAFRGIAEFVRRGANAKIQLIMAVFVVGAGFLLDFGVHDWIAVVVCIGMVLSAEAMNTAIELLADALQPERDERVRVLKDVAAGGVLIAAIVSLVVAILLIGKHLWWF